MDWGDVLSDVLVAMITVFLPVVIGLLVAWLRPILKKWDVKIGNEMGQGQWEFTKLLVYQFVEAAEQRGVWDDLLGEGKEKKDWVISQLDSVLKSYGLVVNWDDIDAAIEEAVRNMNLENAAVTNGSARVEIG